MTCPKCEHIVERPDLPHVLRKCESCGRSLRIHEPGSHGIGFKIRKGDQVVLPSGWLRLSANPLKSSGRFTRDGLEWFAREIFLEDLPKKREGMPAEIDRLEVEADRVLSKSALLVGLDINNPDHAETIIAKLRENQSSAEWWAFMVGTFISFLRDALAKREVDQAVWAMGCIERCRSMLVFKESFEEVIWMGHSASRIVEILRVWDGNTNNADEGFWQHTFRTNVYALSQTFAIPLVFIRESAYVGGMNVDRQNAKFVDYLFSQESSREAVLVEIKTPATPLLGSKYRGTYRPSSELSGTVMQALDYRRTLSQNINAIAKDTGHQLRGFSPKCVVVVGNGALELADGPKRDAFELFRSNSKDVEIVTYDELFRKIEVLASLFSLSRVKKEGKRPAECLVDVSEG